MKTFIDAVQDEDYMKSTARQKMLDLCRTLGEVTTLWAMSFPIGTTVHIETEQKGTSVPMNWTLTVMFIQFDEEQNTRLTLAGSYASPGFARYAPERYWMYMGHEPGSIYPISVEEHTKDGDRLTVREAREADLGEYLLLARSLKQIEEAFNAEKTRLSKDIAEGDSLLRAYFGEEDSAP